MSERKVLNKYYPPDFDPSKIPRMRMPKNRKFCVRLMAPCNMRCDTCGEYIYKGKKFNARKEDVDNLSYLGIRIYRFYIKCTRCLSEISFRTDPENTDYVLEAGATRNFQALKLAEEAAEREEAARVEEEKNNPMKLLEKRTEQSKYEMDMLETLEELKEMNQRQGANLDESLDEMLRRKAKEAAAEKEAEEAEDEAFIQSVFGSKTGEAKKIVRRLDSDDSSSSDSEKEHEFKKPKLVVKKENVDKEVSKFDEPGPSTSTASSSSSSSSSSKPKPSWEKSFGSLPPKKLTKNMLIRPKGPGPTPVTVKVEKEATSSLSNGQAPTAQSTQSEEIPQVKVKSEEVILAQAEKSIPSVADPPLELPALSSSFAKGLAASASSSSGVQLKGAFFNPFGAYGGGSSDDSD